MLLIGTDSGIYRWTEGNGWPVFHGLQDRAAVAVVSAGKGAVAALDDAGLVWESSDGGLNWRNLTVPDGAGTPSSLAVAPGLIVVATNPPTVFARAVGARLREPRPFLTTVLESAESLSRVVELRVRRARSRGAGGVAVAPRRPKPPVVGWNKLGRPPGVLELLHLGADRWFAKAEGAGLVSSADGGANWAKVEGLPAGVNAIRPVPGSPGALVAATDDGVWFGSESGSAWEERSKGLESVKVVRALDACPDDPSYLLAAVNTQPKDAPQGDTLVESRDGGKTWARVVFKAFPENSRFDRIADLRFDPACPENAAVAFASGELWTTTNGGAYWQPTARQIKGARALCPVV